MRPILALLFALALTPPGPAMAAEDRIAMPGPIEFAARRYDLASAGAPQPGIEFLGPAVE